MADQRFLFYSSDRKATSSISWAEQTKTYFFATDARVRTALSRPKMEGSGETLQKQVRRKGGVLVSADNTDGPCLLKIEARGDGKYQAPDGFLMVGAGGSSSWKEIGNEPFPCENHEFAIVPVDRAEQGRLAQMDELLRGLPEDLRGAMLRAIVRRDDPGAAPVEASAWPWWIPAGFGLFVGLVCGVSGLLAYWTYLSPEARTQRVIAEHRQVVGGKLEELKNAMASSTNPQVKSIYDGHSAPQGSWTLTGDAQIVESLALYQASVPAGHASELVSPYKEAVQEVNCLGTPPPYTQTSCNGLPWDKAEQALTTLTEFVHTAPPAISTATPPVSATVAPAAQTEVGKPQLTTGVVKAKSATTITFQATGGRAYTATLDPAAVVTKDAAPALIAELQPGDKISVEGVVTTRKIQATKVSATSPAQPDVSGTVVQAPESGKLIVTHKDRTGRAQQITILVDANTTFNSGNIDPITKNIAQGPGSVNRMDIHTGDRISASGNQTHDGFKASHLTVVPKQ